MRTYAFAKPVSDHLRSGDDQEPMTLGKQISAALPPIACEHCGRRFSRKREWGKFCSDLCRVASHRLEEAVRQISSQLVGVAEAARLLAVSQSTIRRRVERGQLRARRCVGRL